MSGKNVYIAHYREKDNTIQTVDEHILGTAELSRNFSTKINMEYWGELIGLLHDLGKNTDEFNNYIKSRVGLISPDHLAYIREGIKVDHSTAGAQYIFQQDSLDPMVRSIISLLIKSHHGGLKDCVTLGGENRLYNSIQKDDALTRLSEAVTTLNPDIYNRINQLIEKDLFIQLKRNTDIFKQYKNPDISYFMLGLTIRFLFSCLIDADRQDTADFDIPYQFDQRQHGKYVAWGILIDRLEKSISSFPSKNYVDRIRTNISEDCVKSASLDKDIFQLTVPTGGGKTLSSLRFSLKHAEIHNMDRIIYVVPFTTIIDQNADTVRSILEKKGEEGKIVLEHHSNLTPEKDNYKNKLLSENWDSPIVFTTMVQLLESLFGGGTRNVRRMHQLANSIIIFDEIQSLNINTVYMFNSAVRFLKDVCGSTIVLCTATQPLLDKIEPSHHQLEIKDKQKIISDSSKIHKILSRVNLEPRLKIGGWQNDEIIELALKYLEENKNVLIIVNTKKSAIELMEEADPYDDMYERYHLSTLMCPQHRRDKLAEMIHKMKRRKENKKSYKPVFCVSTALIEAGVNIDFDIVIRFLSGLDSIVQAAGRCNRNGELEEKGTIYVVNPAIENLTRLNDIKKGVAVSQRIIEEYKNNPDNFDNDLLSPKALENYYKYYFYERKDEMAYKIKDKEYGVETSIYDLLSTNSKAKKAALNNNIKSITLPYSFETAGKEFKVIDTYTQGIIVPYEKEGKKLITTMCQTEFIYELYPLLKIAQQYSVNLFCYQITALSEKGLIAEVHKDTGIYYLKNYNNYSDIFGLIEENKKQEFLSL